MKEERLVYFIRNAEGLYYMRRAGWSYSACWTDQPSKARLLLSCSPAKSTCTWMANRFPDKIIPHLLEFDLHPDKGKVIDVTAQSQASITKKRLRLEEYEMGQQKVADELSKMM